MKCDVVIIGAGPAGSTLAALLASRGVSVAVADRDTLPRDKVCGEFLSWDALPVLEPLGVIEELDRAAAPAIDHARIIGRSRTAEIAFPHRARGVSRRLLDATLLETAARRGAVRLDGWSAVSLEPRGVVLESNGERRKVEAAIVAGAWGRWGRFDQQLERRFTRERSNRSFGFKRHYRLRAGSSPALSSIDLFAFRRGYLGVNQIEGGLSNICGLVHATRLAGHRGRWDAFIDTIRKEEPRLDDLYAGHTPAQEEFLSSEPVIFRPRAVVEEGVFMIGDASGVIDPLTGNGMAMAIQSSLLAAPLILRLLGRPALRDAIEREYRQRHAAWFGRRIAWSRLAAHGMSRPRLLDLAIALFGGTGAGQLFVDRTRAPYDEVRRMADIWFC